MCMSPYSETLECAISLEQILSATAGRATHGDTHRHTPTLPEGGGAATGPSCETALGGWLAATVRGGPFWWSALPPDTDTLSTHRGTEPGQPPPPRAECSERRGEAASALMGSQVVGCRVTWGGMHTHTHTHTHTRPQPHSSTHRFMPSHVTHTDTATGSLIHRFLHHTDTHHNQKTDKHTDAWTHRDTLRYLQGDAWMCSDTHTHSYTSSPTQACACTHTHRHTHTQSPGI